jgi:hypothetical protein
MKHLYPKFFLTNIIIFLSLTCCYKATAQCPYGITPGGTAYDTTIATPTGINTLQIKFPQADPQAGLVTCMRLCISITGVVDSISVENNAGSPETANINYIRTDQITGPGLGSPLTNTINYMYPPFALGATDGSIGSGPDFASISKDTLLNAVTQCVTITDLPTLFQFYGTDSVTYNYNITAFTIVSVSGGNYNSSVSTSARVRLRLEYCTCPGLALPLSIRNLLATKIADNKVELSWSAFDEQTAAHRYIIEISRDGKEFSEIGEIPKSITPNDLYKKIYTTNQNENGMFFFRVKQVYFNGYTRFSVVKQVYLENSPAPKFTVFPNPSTGIVGIKFDNIESGKMTMQVFNSRGQKVLQKDILVAGSSYQQLGTLESGIYWLRLTDEKNRLSFVNQLMIK